MKSAAEFLSLCVEFDKVTIEVLKQRGIELIAYRNIRIQDPVGLEFVQTEGHNKRTRICNCMDSDEPDSENAQQAMDEWWEMIKSNFGAEDEDLNGVLSVYTKEPFVSALNKMKPGFSEYFNAVGTIFSEQKNNATSRAGYW